ncbi:MULTISPECIES: hypothetical protein [unclassified Mycoplasma]|uniref:hypothetical protein n=1 Tax=unclassified Mycoplasma TaxID=2683645 RepID=UPI002B1DA751|nr:MULTISPECIES: hypothetical protein [unclassified Mycoplasma]MEA4162749.1 hypothetical protein [Mycoplasma sp. 4404]MEA4206321.1 hypothetical protein [Mycoplasma sp. 1199]
MILMIIYYLSWLIDGKMRFIWHKLFDIIRLIDSGTKIRPEIFDYLKEKFLKRLKFEQILLIVFLVIITISAIHTIISIILACIYFAKINPITSFCFYTGLPASIILLCEGSSLLGLWIWGNLKSYLDDYINYLIPEYSSKNARLSNENLYDNLILNAHSEVHFLINEKTKFKTVWPSVRVDISSVLFPWMHIKIKFLKKSKTKKIDIYLAMLLCGDGMWKLSNIELKPEMFYYEYKRTILNENIKPPKQKFVLSQNYKTREIDI